MLFYLLFLLFSLQVGAAPLDARQAAAQPSSVTTVQTINSASGPVTQTCVITLTPITDEQGNDAVREVKTCTVSMATPSSDSPSSSSVLTSTLVSSTAVPVTTSVAPSPTPVGDDGVSSDPVPAPTNVGDSSSISATSTASLSGTLAAAEASATNAAFTLPGKKLSVLPIGLGVFAGISVIALIVVGLVTYERTKYRKAFRQRRLAEAGAAMGNGGSMV